MCSHFALRHYCPCFFSAACGALMFRLLSVWSGDGGNGDAGFFAENHCRWVGIYYSQKQGLIIVRCPPTSGLVVYVQIEMLHLLNWVWFEGPVRRIRGRDPPKTKLRRACVMNDLFFCGSNPNDDAFTLFSITKGHRNSHSCWQGKSESRNVLLFTTCDLTTRCNKTLQSFQELSSHERVTFEGWLTYLFQSKCKCFVHSSLSAALTAI